MNDSYTLTIPDTVRASGMSRSRVYTLLNEGELQAIRVGRRTLVLNSSLREFIDRQPRAIINRSPAGVAA